MKFIVFIQSTEHQLIIIAIKVIIFNFVMLNSHDRQLEIIHQQELAEKLSNARKFSGR